MSVRGLFGALRTAVPALVVSVLLVAGAQAATSAATRATAGGKQLTLYTVATDKQFVNNADDRSRGGAHQRAAIRPP